MVKAETLQAGFPFFQLERFLKILVQEFDESVAISEEFANNASSKVKSGGLLFDRKVTRVVSPGTLIDEKFINPYENNFLLAISPLNPKVSSSSLERASDFSQSVSSIAHEKVGLAWLDLSTGDFYTQLTAGALLQSTVARIGAREIVLDSAASEAFERGLLEDSDQQRRVVARHRTEEPNLPVSQWTPMLESSVSPQTESTFSKQEVTAGNILLEYVKGRIQSSGLRLQAPLRRQDEESMSIDKNSLRCLEVLQTSKGSLQGGVGSLLHSVRRTVTKGGTRLLKDWIGKFLQCSVVTDQTKVLPTPFLALRLDVEEL